MAETEVRAILSAVDNMTGPMAAASSMREKGVPVSI